MKTQKSPLKILIGRGDALGDVVLSTVLIKPLKTLFPHSELYFLVQAPLSELLLESPDIDGVIIDPHSHHLSFSDCSSFIKQVMSLRNQTFDLFIGAWNTPRYAWLSFLAGIPIRIGHKYPFINCLLYTHLSSINPQDFTRHDVDWNLSLLSAFTSTSFTPTLSLPAAKSLSPSRFPSTPYICLHIDSGIQQKRTTSENLLSLLHILLKRYHYPICLIGQDAALSSQLCSQLNDSTRIINFVHTLSVSELSSLISNATLFIGSDSGPAHIAAAFQIPSVVYFQTYNQNPFRWRPFNPYCSLVFSSHNCPDLCRSTLCQKMTCRESFPFQDFQNALVLCDAQSPCSSQWQQKALRIGLSCLPQTVSDHLHQQGWRPFVCDSQSLKALYLFITRRHLHLLFISSLSPWKRFLLDILCSNYLDWKPHIYVVSSLSDLQKVLASYDSGLNTSGLFAHSHVRYS